MNELNKTRIYSYSGLAFAVLGLLLPVFKVPQVQGWGLLTHISELGMISWAMYFILIIALAGTAYGGYVVFKKPADLKKAAFASAGVFAALVIMIVVLRSVIAGGPGAIGNFAAFFKPAPGMYMFVLSWLAYFLAYKELKAM